MRVIVFFDLPTESVKDRREYSRFRRMLIKNGFMMMQESVYVKLTLNQNTAQMVVDGIKKNKPPQGLVQVLCITEKQFQRMELISGSSDSDVLDTDDRLLIL
ncbi:MAG: CRISPR-associated endonuclease Cas2 [Ruminococcus sp.]|nr:CRISPR-associated endonuclease Cas2 [Ruminococcus sp.]